MATGSKFGLHVFWSKTKTHNQRAGTMSCSCNCDSVDTVQGFTYLDSIQSSNSNSSSEYTRRIGLTAGVMTNETPGPCLEAKESQHIN